jgi:hypothetical protein
VCVVCAVRMSYSGYSLLLFPFVFMTPSLHCSLCPHPVLIIPTLTAPALPPLPNSRPHSQTHLYHSSPPSLPISLPLPLLQASRMFETQAKARDETALLIILASETEVELDEVRYRTHAPSSSPPPLLLLLSFPCPYPEPYLLSYYSQTCNT